MQLLRSTGTWLGLQIHLEATQRESHQATRRIELRLMQPPARYPARYPNGVRVGALAGAWYPNYVPTWAGYVPRSMGGRLLDLFIARIFRTQLLFHRTPHMYINRRNGSIGGHKGGLWVGRWAGSSGGWSPSLGWWSLLLIDCVSCYFKPKRG